MNGVVEWVKLPLSSQNTNRIYTVTMRCHIIKWGQDQSVAFPQALKFFELVTVKLFERHTAATDRDPFRGII